MISTFQTLSIPRPPKFLLESEYPGFYPSEDIDDFVRNTFLNDSSELFNEDHLHLGAAEIGYLWTNVENVRQMVQVVATAQIPQIQGNIWTKGIFDFQMANWFGTDNLNFLITIDAKSVEFMDEVSFCAVLEHELYHCATKGFNRLTGLPKFTMRDHDVSEFLGVTRRYGPSVSRNVPEMIEAAQKTPLFSNADIRAVCGTCLGLRA